MQDAQSTLHKIYLNYLIVLKQLAGVRSGNDTMAVDISKPGSPPILTGVRCDFASVSWKFHVIFTKPDSL
jgi:hypothetical protein